MKNLYSKSETKIGYSFFLPAFIVLCIFLLWPCLQLLILSFTKTNMLRPDQAGKFIGLRNYINLYKNAEFWTAGYRSLVFTAIATVVSIVLSYLIASLVNFDFRGKSLVYAGLFLPWVISDVITAFIFRWSYDMTYGIVNYLLSETLHILSGPIPWLGRMDTAMPAVIIANVWRLMPFSTMVIIAALKQVPAGLLEAARMDGASNFRVHTKVIIPSIKAPLAVLYILRIGALFRSFDIIWLLTKGGPGNATNVLPIYYYRTAFEGMSLGSGAAIAVHILLFVIVCYYIIFRLFGKEAFS